jgi:hypothetical protein
MAIRRTWAALLAAAIFGLNGHAQVPAHQELTFNGDGALLNNQIHWPKGFEPEQADFFAHNEIDLQEVVKGPGAMQFREQQPNAMHEGHQLWLTTLKDRSEKH